jgi:putative molybdopterin biosynthesis protein
MSKDIYLDNVPLDEASEKWFNAVRTLFEGKSVREAIPAGESLHRVTAEAVSAEISSPFYHASAMDGYAVNFSDTFGASETTPVTLAIPEKARYLDTGDPIADGFNGVIKIEDVNVIEENSKQYIEIYSPVTPWENVRVIGEDIVATELILPENARIRPIDVAAILAGGITTLQVKKKPVVGIVPTGDEIVEYGKKPETGEIIDTNSYMLSGYLTEDGAAQKRYPVVPDQRTEIRNVVEKAVSECDIVLVIAGSSAGSEDYTSDVIAELGDVLVHGVSIKPGKPVVLGKVHTTPVVGIPGYPVSAYLAYHLFVKPVIDEHFGQGKKKTDTFNAKLSRQVSSALGVEEFVRMKLGDVSGTLIATPVSRGAGIIMSLVRADGIMRIPAMSEGFAIGAHVDIEILRGMSEIKNTIVCMGSHDNTLDIIANYLKKRYPEYSLSSAHTGSMGGIMAIKNGEAHVAGSHLLDEATGTYNIPFIKKYLDKKQLSVINLVFREQGLLIKKGNPKKIQGVEDLARNDVVFINRQAGSGTRLLTDKYLRDLNMTADAIQGYNKCEFTHMSVASAVKSGVADAGMGIYSASVALELDFIPVARERYDIIIPGEFIKDEKIKAFIDIIKNDRKFRSTVEELGGYDVTHMGEVVYEQ